MRDAVGRIRRIIDPAGEEIVFTYQDGDLVSVRDRENNETRFRYDGEHRVAEIIDPRGVRAIRNEYDADGRLIGHDIITERDAIKRQARHEETTRFDVIEFKLD